MKSLKIGAFAALAIFFIACDYANQTTPTSDSFEAVGSSQPTHEELAMERDHRMHLDSTKETPVE